MSMNESRVYIAFDDDDVVVKVFEDREECIAFCRNDDYGWKAAPFIPKPQHQPISFYFNKCDKCGGYMKKTGINQMMCMNCGNTWNNI